MRRKKRWQKVDWEKAPDIKKRVKNLKTSLSLNWIRIDSIHCFRSNHSSSSAYARIWGLSRVWQKALKTNPAYIIEVLSEKFDKLSNIEKDKVLLHEISHIPQNFSGSLLPHIRKKGRRNFKDRVNKLISMYQRIK